MELGVGIVYWPGLEPLLLAPDTPAQVVEVEPQTFWFEPGGRHDDVRADPDVTRRIRALPQAKLVHGVGLPIASSLPLEPRRCALYRRTVTDLEATWASEHLAFNRAPGPAGAFGTGFLLPPRQTIDGVITAAARIRELSFGLTVPFAFETGVNYLRPRADEMSDGAFVAAVATVADCGILLDLHNLWTNQRNGRQTVDAFLEEIPLERVIEIHLAGGVELDGYWLDAHSGMVPEELAEIARRVVPALPNLGAIVFEMMPTHLTRVGLRAVRGQLEALHDLWALRRPDPEAFQAAAADAVVIRRPGGASSFSPAEWEQALGALVAGRPARGTLADELSADRGVALLRKLASEARAGMITGALPLTTRLILLARGEVFHRALLAEFERACPPQEFASSEALALAGWLEERDDLDVPYLREVISFEIAIVRAAIDCAGAEVRFQHDPAAVLEALAEGRMPPAAARGDFTLRIDTRVEGDDPGIGRPLSPDTGCGGGAPRRARHKWPRLVRTRPEDTRRKPGRPSGAA
jgi:uncharacterized protein (UPF0276 family)